MILRMPLILFGNSVFKPAAKTLEGYSDAMVVTISMGVHIGEIPEKTNN
jgi:hypothetical protein